MSKPTQHQTNVWVDGELVCVKLQGDGGETTAWYTPEQALDFADAIRNGATRAAHRRAAVQKEETQ